MIKTLLSYVKQYKKASLLTPLFTGLEVLFEVLIPYVVASIIDKGIIPKDLHNVYYYGMIMVFLALCSLVCGVLAGRFASTASTGFAANLRQAIFNKIQTFSFSNIDRFSTAGLVTRITTDVTNVQNAYQMCLRIAVRSPLMLICSLTMCMIVSPKLSIIFFVAIIVLAILLFLMISSAWSYFNEAFKSYDDLNLKVQENVTAIRVVKAYVRENYENEKFFKRTEKLKELFYKAESKILYIDPSFELAIYTSMILIAWFGARSVVGGSITTGELTSMFTYILSIFMSIIMLSMVIVMIAMAFANAKRISEVLNEVPDIVNPENPIYEVKDGSIEFNDVNFRYQKGSGDDTLKNINLSIKKGEMIGLIGSTASGKSSLVSLISRLYDVTSGSVKVGGVDVRDYDIETLRNDVAVVLQKNVLFSGSILDNISFGLDVSYDECVSASKVACADEFVSRMPDGYDTLISQGGTNVSGGQKQRLCIARALVKRPKVLILDDSTSAVDTATDKKIRESFRQNLKDTTKIIISQRISSVEDLDRIIVLNEGEINGFDTHENLLKNNAIYREIYETQTQNTGDFDEKEGAHE